MSNTFKNRVEQLAQASRVFPNIGLAGCYEPLSQTVTVLVADAAERERWRGSGNPEYEAREYLATAVHELTHWVDGTSTLWGQALLVDIHNALTAWRARGETEFWRVLTLYNRLNRGGKAPYYSTVNQPGNIGGATSWKVSFSAGLEFGVDGRLNHDRPLVFVNFTDVHGDRICRVPLTEMALLEANAMWAEVVTREQLLRTVPEEFRPVERATADREMTRHLYTSDLAIYSAAVHLVANFHRMTSAYVGLEAAGRLATAALNVPARLVAEVDVPKDMREGWGPRIDAFRRLGDPGFLFFVLCQTAPRFEPGVAPAEWVDAALRGAGLPPASDVAAMAAEEMASLPERVVTGGPFGRRAHAILEIGRENFRVRGLTPEQPLSLSALADPRGLRLPPAILLDESLAPLTPLPITDPLLDPLASLEYAADYQQWAKGFVDSIRF